MAPVALTFSVVAVTPGTGSTTYSLANGNTPLVGASCGTAASTGTATTYSVTGTGTITAGTIITIQMTSLSSVSTAVGTYTAFSCQ